LKKHKLRDRLHGEMRPILDWAREQSVHLRVVSASPLPVVQAGVELWGIEANKVIAASASLREAQISVGMASLIPYGPGKVQALKRSMPDMHLIGAFGDNVFDIEMLQLSEVPVAVRPKKRLMDRRIDVPTLIELEAC
jgi:phosphoserine phosphatase